MKVLILCLFDILAWSSFLCIVTHNKMQSLEQETIKALLLETMSTRRRKGYIYRPSEGRYPSKVWNELKTNNKSSKRIPLVHYVICCNE